MSTPLFSIVIPCRNAAATIRRALESCVAQSCDDYELVIVDGASTDGTTEIIGEFQDATGGRLRLISEPDDGIYDAMNKGLAAARGEWVAFLGADDWYEPGALATVRDCFSAPAEGSRVDCVGGAMWVVEPDGHRDVRLPHPGLLRRRFPKAMPAGHQAWFARSELLRRVGGFNTDFRLAADYELYLRVQASGSAPVWVFTDTPIVNFTLGGASWALRACARDYRAAKLANGDRAFHADVVYVRNLILARLAR
ncbi:MAG: glycosyltransferase [Actinomycetes bacterium]|nr:glycosyltransferase [Actinomycetes bacterium]